MVFFYREHRESSGLIGASAALARRLMVRLRETGPVLFALIVVNRLTPNFLFTASELLVLVSDIPASAMSETPDPGLRWANDAEMEIIAARAPRGAVLHEQYGADSIVAVIMDGEKISALEWFVMPPHDCKDSWVFALIEAIGWIHFRTPREDIWSVWSWVDPGQRGKRLIVRCQSFANIRLAETNFARSWGMYDSGNVRAIHAHAKRAYHAARRITYMRVMGLTFLRLDGALKIGCWTKNRPFEIALPASKAGKKKADI